MELILSDYECKCDGKIALQKLADLAAPNGGNPISRIKEIYNEWDALFEKIVEVYSK